MFPLVSAANSKPSSCLPMINLERVPDMYGFNSQLSTYRSAISQEPSPATTSRGNWLGNLFGWVKSHLVESGLLLLVTGWLAPKLMSGAKSGVSKLIPPAKLDTPPLLELSPEAIQAKEERAKPHLEKAEGFYKRALRLQNKLELARRDAGWLGRWFDPEIRSIAKERQDAIELAAQHTSAAIGMKDLDGHVPHIWGVQAKIERLTTGGNLLDRVINIFEGGRGLHPERDHNGDLDTRRSSRKFKRVFGAV